MVSTVAFLLSLLPDGLSLHGLLFLLAVVLVAGLARGFSGFGGALIFMPLASIVISPQLASAALLIADGFAALSLIPNALATAPRRDPLLLAAGALFGAPLGTLALVHAPPVTLRWAISITVLCLLMLLASGLRYTGQSKTPLSIAVGLVSGFFSGAAQLGGPPVVAYLIGRDMPGRMVRASIILFFAMSTCISAASYGLNGLLTLTSLTLAIIIAPVFSLGLYLGSRLFGVASEALFRRVCFGLIAAAAIGGLPVLERLF